MKRVKRKTQRRKRKRTQRGGNPLTAIDVAQSVYKLLPGVDKNLMKKFWSGKIAKGVFNKKNGILTKKFWKPAGAYKDSGPGKSCNRVVYDKKSGKYRNKYC